MGGPQSAVDVDQRVRAIACLTDSALASRVHDALAAADFDVMTAGELADVRDVAAEIPPDASTVLVFDESTDGWLGLIARLTDEHPSMRAFLLADVDGPDAFLSAVTAGVAGFCHPDASGDAIVRSIRSMIADGVAIPRPFVAPLVDAVRRGRGHVVATAAGDVALTDREWDILQLLVQRRSTREMADALFVSVGTVRSHVSTLLRKLGAVDRDDVIAMVSRGRVDPPPTG